MCVYINIYIYMYIYTHIHIHTLSALATLITHHMYKTIEIFWPIRGATAWRHPRASARLPRDVSNAVDDNTSV